MTSKFLSAETVANHLGLPRYWFVNKNMREKFHIPHYRVGNRVLFIEAEIDFWVNSYVNTGLIHVNDQ